MAFTEVCEDMHENCGANPGWPRHWCNHADFGNHIRQQCPAMCGLCTAGTVVYIMFYFLIKLLYYQTQPRLHPIA